MIKANELRIGNWVGGRTNEWNKFVKIDPAVFEYIFGEDEMPFDPIPLTPEILEKAGFVHEIVNDENGLDGDSAYKKGRIVFMHTEKDWYWDSDFSAIQYVHQLQNLYFALTGEELDIKMT